MLTTRFRLLLGRLRLLPGRLAPLLLAPALLAPGATASAPVADPRPVLLADPRPVLGELTPFAADAPAATPLWVPPLSGRLDITGPYRAPPHRYGAGHRGIDLRASPGDSVVAPAAGTVTFSGRVVDREVVSVRVDERTVYSLEPVRGGVVAGSQVAAGALLGEVDRGGHCGTECVHLGVRVEGEYVTPLRYLLPRPRLLPTGGEPP
ncbi:murein hydrolase activator EnvC family protein [Leucobacter massiliensis]|uniref:M23ase beta-sheet core domain-containing protein n=1 Tax=Leucobacter massiliensis TaxID=1686285 RepID=A0A2S9QMT9_9MICO|nr:M23 family metallopeptidase [Leucobacter massiliensis]PRI10902.1 hypothetical protein B4915_08430 [Leucobacter massiliensis]